VWLVLLLLGTSVLGSLLALAALLRTGARVELASALAVGGFVLLPLGLAWATSRRLLRLPRLGSFSRFWLTGLLLLAP